PANGTVIPVADIAAGKLVYSPPANANGNLYAKFSFQVRDNGGTANGGVDTDPVARSMYVTITSVNDAPVGTAKAVTILEDHSYTFTVADFGFSDPNDNPANAFASIKITNVATASGLTYNGTPPTNGQVIPVADIAAGKLVYTPPANANGNLYAKFSFQVRDNGGTSNGGVDTDPVARSMYVSIISVNDAPVGTSKTVTILEGTSYTFTVNDFGYSDPSDNPANAFASVVVTTIPENPGLTYNGAPLTSGMVIPVADIAAGKLKFVPPDNGSGGAFIKFTFQVRDNGGTANGGQNTDPTPRTIFVTHTAINDPPVGTPKTVSIAKNSTYTFAATDFGFSDPNDTPPNAFLAVKISSLPNAGALTLNGVAVTSGLVILVADINAGKLKFAPAANATGAPYASFTFQVRDNGGTANGGVDTDIMARTFTFNVS
ncbi:Ig-like domain-containing protein, partial [Singulisphaera rosea]